MKQLSKKYVQLDIVNAALTRQEEAIFNALMNAVNDTQMITGESTKEFYQRQAHRLAEGAGAECGYHAENLAALTPDMVQQIDAKMDGMYEEIEALHALIEQHTHELEEFASEHNGTHSEKRGALMWIARQLRSAQIRIPHTWRNSVTMTAAAERASSDSEIPF